MPRCFASRARVATLAGLVFAAACQDVPAPTSPPLQPPAGKPDPTPPAPVVIDTNAARIAWAYVEHNTTAATGLANAVYPFQYVTAWDIASLIGATYSAHEIGLLGDSAYDGRLRAILVTLLNAPLFEGAAFNKSYDSHTGQMIDGSRRLSATGYGWSATDIGRLLVWLRIVATHQPRYAALATGIVDRIDMRRLIRNGTLQGRDVDPASGIVRDYAETGLGYEQYAAAGYALWGHRAESSLDAVSHASVVSVFGVPISVDARGNARITSEPYVMMGLETGFPSLVLREQALALLAAQEARYTRTGTMTMVSEDALPDAPYYFYYYSLYHNGRSFVVEGPDDGTYIEAPRWVSTKAAFGWHALFPTTYTTLAVAAVQSAGVADHGWGAGVYEATHLPANEASLNTAAVVLESLAYQSRRGRALME